MNDGAAHGSLGRELVARGMRLVAHRILREHRAEVHIDGDVASLARGPVLIAARHYHHLLDGAALVAAIERPLHLFVALDWITTRRERFFFETLCRVAAWPAGMRAQPNASAAYRAADRTRYLRRAIADGADLLAGGARVGIFPEGEPVVDPHAPGRTDLGEKPRPLHPGCCAIVEAAQARGVNVPIVPLWLAYRQTTDRLRIELRPGDAFFHRGRAERATTMLRLAEAFATLAARR